MKVMDSIMEYKHRLGDIKRAEQLHWKNLKFTRKLKKELQKPGKKIFYFGVPIHPNLGDLAQYYCIRNLLKEQYSDYQLIEVTTQAYLDKRCNAHKYVSEAVKPEDLIFFQSGYCTHDLGGKEDIMHQVVIREHSENTMVMLPQTVFFKSEKRKRRAEREYNKAKKLLFLARDQVSYQYARDMFQKLTVKAYPDIVTSLIGKYHFDNERKGILFCLRNDGEKYYSEEELNELRQICSKYDKVDILDTTLTKTADEILGDLENNILGFIEEMSKYKVVVTDRYHGTIFSIIAGTPVIIIKSTDHKVITGADWFKGIYDDQVLPAASLELVPDMIEHILKDYEYHAMNTAFREKYYANFRDMIEKWEKEHASGV